MSEITSNPADFLKTQVKYDFVVNEFPRIKVPTKTQEPQNYKEMPRNQREKLLMRLIEKVDEI